MRVNRDECLEADSSPNRYQHISRCLDLLGATRFERLPQPALNASGICVFGPGTASHALLYPAGATLQVFTGRMKRIFATGALALLMAGCGQSMGDLDAPDSPVARYDWSPRDGGMQSLMEGTLSLIDGCLYIVGEANELEPTLPVFSRSFASWDNDAQTLTYDGVPYELGDEVAAGGGWGPPSEDADVPAACKPDAYGDVMYVQDTSLAPMSERGY